MLEDLGYPRKIACKRCRRRKKKCDHEKPVCGECRKTRSECIPSNPVRSPVDSPANYIKSLESHIASLEQYIVKLEDVARISNPEVVRDHLWLEKSPVLAGSTRQAGQVHQHDIESCVSGPDAASIEVINDDDNVQNVADGFDMDYAYNFYQLLPKPVQRRLSHDLPGFSRKFSEYPHAFSPGFDSLFGFRAQVATHLSNAETTRGLSQIYDKLYFTNVQSSWPFLQETRWKEWADSLENEMSSSTDDWRGFFVDMVRSVGALVAQKFDKGSLHIERSKFYHERAKKSLPQDLSQASPILHTQSSLLLTMHAMHSESADMIDDYASKAMMHCALAGLYQEKVRRNQSSDQPRNQDEICEKMIRRQVMRVCYGLDRLIAMAFDRPVSVADELIDTESLSRSRGDSIIFQDLPPNSTTATGAAETDHRFLLRQIQSKIHTAVERAEYHSLCLNKEVTNLFSSPLRLELDQWKSDLAHVSDPMSYSSTSWLSNLYYYNVLALFPNMHLAVNCGEVRYVVQAGSEVLRNFRFVQIPDQKSCYTWTALVHQFQAGITLLYCFWATPQHLAHEVYGAPDIDVALLACAATLAEFALRWESAKSFKCVFDLLNDGVVRKGRRVDNCAWRFHGELYQFVGELRKGRAHRRVLKLVEEMSGAVDQ